MTHDCSVCLEEISQTTGSSTMACGHSFHIRCLGTWLLQHETCPYCRHEANEHERINKELQDDESTEYEDEEESVEDEGEQWVRVGAGRWITIRRREQVQQPLAIPEYDEEAHAFWVFRKTMEILESGEELAAQKEIPQPAVVLPEIAHGYWDHLADPHDGYETD